MAKSIGVILSERILAGVVVDHTLAGEPVSYPENPDDEHALVELHTDSLVETLCRVITRAAAGATDFAAVGIALPGFVRDGVVEDAPNLPQLKGARIGELVTKQLAAHGFHAPVTILNDADGVAAGLAGMRGKLGSTIRVWTLGVGIGYGVYPFSPGAFEGGHTVVSLDEKERFCGCGGRGHVEGIMGHRAMRLRFLDMEPEEVFEAANRQGANGLPSDPRCHEFKRLWHKALAAATASSIHQGGPGKFYLTGFNVRFIDMPMLRDYLLQMVKMSPLQSYSVEVVPDDSSTRIVGSAVAAEQALAR